MQKKKSKRKLRESKKAKAFDTCRLQKLQRVIFFFLFSYILSQDWVFDISEGIYLQEVYVMDKGQKPAHDIWFRYSDLIYKHCLLKCGDKEKAMDFYQEIFLKYHKFANQVAEHPSPYRWFLQVIENQCRSEWRQSARREARILKNKNLWYCSTNIAKDEEIVKELDFISCSALERMILDFIYAGFNLNELSLILGVSVISIRRKLYKLKKRLESSPENLQEE